MNIDILKICCKTYLCTCDSVIEGAPVHITFSIYGQPLPDVSWYFDGQPIIPNGDYKIMSDGCQHMLSISSVAVSMGGRYSAKAKNPYGEEELGIRVTVEGKEPVSQLICWSIIIIYMEFSLPFYHSII